MGGGEALEREVFNLPKNVSNGTSIRTSPQEQQPY